MKIWRWVAIFLLVLNAFVLFWYTSSAQQGARFYTEPRAPYSLQLPGE